LERIIIDISEFRRQEFEQREKRLPYIKKQTLVIQKKKKEKLHIVYVMTHVGICGGTKIILQHANLLSDLMQQVTLISHFDKPNWFPISDNVQYLQIPFSKELAEGIPPCDVIIATYWREISECVARKLAPVIYFEQGDYHLFDWENVSDREKKYIFSQFQLPDFLFTVSSGAALQIKKLFGRDSKVIHNGIDHNIFYPSTEISAKNDSLHIMTIGSENSLFKGISGIKKALQILNAKGIPYEFIWVTPDTPQAAMGYIYVNPPQFKIASLLRTSDIYICNSLFESFSLPVLEAMTCGCAVITSENSGVKEYATDRENCLMVKMNSPKDIADKIIELHRNPDLRKLLIEKGNETADSYDWKNLAPQILAYYNEIAEYSPLQS